MTNRPRVTRTINNGSMQKPQRDLPGQALRIGQALILAVP
jgi:hypothetical protein